MMQAMKPLIVIMAAFGLTLGAYGLAGGFGPTGSQASRRAPAVVASSPAPSDGTFSDAAAGTPTPSPVGAAYTTAQVSAHGDASSCWTIIRGQVYDLTNLVGQHTGGEGAILQVCGRDGTSVFEGQHSGNAQVMGALSKMHIGTQAP